MSESEDEEQPEPEANGAADADEEGEDAEADAAPATGPSGSSHRGRLKRHRGSGELRFFGDGAFCLGIHLTQILKITRTAGHAPLCKGHLDSCSTLRNTQLSLLHAQHILQEDEAITGLAGHAQLEWGLRIAQEDQ